MLYHHPDEELTDEASLMSPSTTSMSMPPFSKSGSIAGRISLSSLERLAASKLAFIPSLGESVSMKVPLAPVVAFKARIKSPIEAVLLLERSGPRCEASC